MNKFKYELIKGYSKYFTDKLKSDRVPHFFGRFSSSCKAAQTLINEYDLGIELAADGLYLGYIFQLHGFPTKAIKLSRTRMGVSWDPLDELKSEDVENKKILIFDNDLITGITASRAVQELNKFNPQYMDLLLMEESTTMSVEFYKRYQKFISLFSIRDSFVFEPVDIRKNDEGIEVDYYKQDCKGENPYLTTKHLSNNSLLTLNVRENIPQTIRKTMTIEKDFQDKSKQGIRNLENLLISKSK